MINKNKNKSGGFAALITVIILSLVLILVAATLSQSGFFTREIFTDSEFKEKSLGLAEACVDYTILRLVGEPGYNPPVDTVIDLGAEECKIHRVLTGTPLPGQITIETKGARGKANTNVRAVINAADSKVLDWQEVASF